MSAPIDVLISTLILPVLYLTAISLAFAISIPKLKEAWAKRSKKPFGFILGFSLWPSFISSKYRSPPKFPI